MHNAIINPSGWARINDLRSLGVPYRNSTIWQKVASGEFPAPVKLSAGVTAWRIADVLAWIEDQAAKPVVSDQSRGARLTAARLAKRQLNSAPAPDSIEKESGCSDE